MRSLSLALLLLPGARGFGYFVRIGGAGDDVISTAGDYVQSVYGGDGDDTITSNGDTNMRFYGGDGNDNITMATLRAGAVQRSAAQVAGRRRHIGGVPDSAGTRAPWGGAT